MISRRRLLQASPALLLPPWLQGCSPSGDAHELALHGKPPRNPGPRGLHLSWTDDPHTTRTVTWFTDAVDDPPGRLEFGHDEYTWTATATTQPAYDVPVTTHRALMSGFDPQRPLRYRVRNGARVSPEFTIAPSRRDSFRFAHFGDHGLTAYSRAVRDGVLQRDNDFFLIAGDLSYADGNQPVWDDWFDHLEPLAARVPMMCCPGNHERKDGNGAAFRTRLSHPGSRQTFYSFDYGRVHFMVSSGGAMIADGVLPLELLKIELDLAAAALRRALGGIDFIVFVQHYTIWTDETGRSPSDPALVLLLENTLLRYGVDLLLVGHDHSYQRSWPMALGAPAPAPFGYVQVVAGGGGQGMRTFDGFGEWSASQQRRYGFVEYAVEPGTIRATTWAADEYEDGPPTSRLTAIDEFTLIRRAGWLNSAAAKSPRELPAILADAGMDWPSVETHTRLRNAGRLDSIPRVA